MADERSRDSATEQRRPDAERSVGRPGQPGQHEAATKPAPDQQSADEVMKVRKAAGSISEVVEPVQRTRLERTDR
jgi:hypothetical protein